MGWLSNAFGAVFGSSGNGKSVAETAVSAYERFNPSEVKQHEMSVEDQKAGDDSQSNAYGLSLASHDSWFDIFIDGVNRSVRPFITFWVIGILTGWWGAPDHLSTINPLVLNICWTVITFWFGSRVLFKDIPGAFMSMRNFIKK